MTRAQMRGRRAAVIRAHDCVRSNEPNDVNRALPTLIYPLERSEFPWKREACETSASRTHISGDGYMAYVISELNLERQKLLGKVLGPVTDMLLSALALRSE